ncbi:hypothetical protein ACHAWF_003042 [Thalassiosira exigua]
MSGRAADSGRPAKKARPQDGISFAAANPPSRGGAVDRLPSLLAALNGGPPDLAVLAAIKAGGQGCSDGASTDNPHGENLTSIVEGLFADRVGKSPKIVVGNAVRHAREEVRRELDVFDKTERGVYFGNERQKWLNHPQNCDIAGPQPDGRVWLELFLGEARAGELLEGSAPMISELSDPNHESGTDDTESVILTALTGEASNLSTIELIANVLCYVRKEADAAPLSTLLRFSVLYGLDGVMTDVLRGKYGDVEDLTINTPLPLDDEPMEVSKNSFLFGDNRKMLMPPYAMGAILGHSNITIAALTELGGKLDAPRGMQFEPDEEPKIFDDHRLPSEVFHWVFQKNNPDMIKCLVRECGFQFRWITHDKHIPAMFRRIFHAVDWADFPKWAGEMDEEELVWECKRERYRMRSESAYKVQMEMLDVLIALGFPFELFFPTEPPVYVEERLEEEKKLETRQQLQDFVRGLSEGERKARQDLLEACSGYNSTKGKEPDMLTGGDFYRKLKSRWEKSEEPAQVTHLDDFEVLDSRWRQKQE